MDRYFDDFEIGERFRSRGATMTEADTIEFALDQEPVGLRCSKAKRWESEYRF